VARLVLGFAACLWIHARTPGLDRGAIRATLASVTAGLEALRVPFERFGDTLTIGGASLKIVPDCTPLMPTLLATVAILAFPAPWAARAWGIVGVAAALWIYNLLRIAVLFGVMLRWPEGFGFVHVYLWQTVTLVVVIALFMAWLGLCERAGRDRGGRPRRGPRAAESA
jgi:exosortase/archaeosortase family protein